MTITDAPLFFSYSIEEEKDPEDHLLLLNVSNRTKLQVYVHLHGLPDEYNHYYPLGDVPQHVLKKLFAANRKMEYF